MPSLKIYPPARLPSSNVSETQFSMWREELEVYLSQEADFKLFLPNKLYATWESCEENTDRITALKTEDLVHANNDRQAGRIITEDEALATNDERLDSLRTSLRTVLSIVGKCVSEGHYNSVIRHSTSLKWIYDMLKSDYDIQNKGVHFFNILEVKYNAVKHTPVAFYNMYRTVIANNLAKRGEVLKYKNNEELTHDEKFTPMLEDLVLLDAIKEIDHRLPNVVKTFYYHKMKEDERLMDFKTDILLNVPKFLEQIETKTDDDIQLNVFKQNQQRWRSKPKLQDKNKKYCRFCFLTKKHSGVYSSHNFGDVNCPSLSNKDRANLLETAKLSLVKEESDDEQEVDHEELAEMYGYGNSDHQESDQVHSCQQNM